MTLNYAELCRHCKATTYFYLTTIKNGNRKSLDSSLSFKNVLFINHGCLGRYIQFRSNMIFEIANTFVKHAIKSSKNLSFKFFHYFFNGIIFGRSALCFLSILITLSSSKLFIYKIKLVIVRALLSSLLVQSYFLLYEHCWNAHSHLRWMIWMAFTTKQKEQPCFGNNNKGLVEKTSLVHSLVPSKLFLHLSNDWKTCFRSGQESLQEHKISKFPNGI